jgi:two-component system response regulator PilR (NtrC family)
MKKFRILIVEDEQSVADALRIIMEDEGCDVSVASSGLDGLEQYAHHEFDLAITDVNLPDVSGLEVLRRLRESVPPRPVIVITALYTPEIISAAKEHGALAVLPKPFFPSDIINLIRQVFSDADGVSQG